jgi:class 3 adenylate cyclase/ActR/RegA family two-component response regulator
MKATPSPSEHERFHAAWLAHSRQELETPALAVREYIQLLRAGLSADLPAALAGDLAKLGQYGDRLAERVHEFLEISATPADADPKRLDEVRRTIRHDLRSVAGFIVSLAEALGEEHNQLAPATVEGLQRVTAAARRVIALIEELVHYSPTVSEGGTVRLTEEMRSTLESLAALPAVQATQTGRILLVDDSADNRELYSAILTAQGHTVTLAADGQSALDFLAQAGSEGCDLVLLDVMMPGVSGLEVLERIKSQPRFRHLPVVLMSALGEEEVVVNSLLRGAEDYLRRPVSPLLLRARISNCLETKRLRDREQGYQRRIDELLHALFPPAIVSELKEKGTVQSRRHERVGVMFLDVVGFTPFCEAHKHDPETVVDRLQWFVRILERTARRHGVQKIKTVGDAFLATAGLLADDPEPVATLVRCAADMIAEAGTPVGWQVRVGIHRGPVVAGIVGETQFGYDVWGDTVNMAARVESAGRPGLISLSAEAYDDVRARFPAAAPRDVALRGIGPVVLYDLSPAQVTASA